ncbi:hypothetical protein [Adlercreutzia rubneri]
MLESKIRSSRCRIVCLVLLVAMAFLVIGAVTCICDLSARGEVASVFAEVKMASEGVPTKDGTIREGVDKFRPLADAQGDAALVYRVVNLKLGSVRLSGDSGMMLVSYDLETVKEGKVVGINRNQAAEVLLGREKGSWSIADVSMLL